MSTSRNHESPSGRFDPAQLLNNANHFRLLLASAAYVLIEHVRREGLKDTELAEAQVNTIRLKLLKVAARVVVSVRRVVLHLSSSYPYQPLLQRLVVRLVPS